MSGREIDLDNLITVRGFSFAPLLSVNLTSKLVLIILLPYGGKQGPLWPGLLRAVQGHSELD